LEQTRITSIALIRLTQASTLRIRLTLLALNGWCTRQFIVLGSGGVLVTKCGRYTLAILTRQLLHGIAPCWTKALLKTQASAVKVYQAETSASCAPL